MSHGAWLSLPERIGRLEATIESLIRENGELRRRVENAVAAEEILRRAQAPPLPVPQRRAPAAHKRDRHGLHIVRGAALAALAWAGGSRAHKVVAAAAGLALATGAVTVPAVISAGPPAHARSGAAVTRHRQRPAPAPTWDGPRKAARSSSSPRPRRAGVTPSPSPSLLPTVTVTPLPSPAAAVSPGPSLPPPEPPVTPPPLACHPMPWCPTAVPAARPPS